MKYKIYLKGYRLMFKLFEVQEKDKDIIFNLMQLYTYELSFFEDETTNFQLQDNGLFKLSKYMIFAIWTQERHPYILKYDVGPPTSFTRGLVFCVSQYFSGVDIIQLSEYPNARMLGTFEIINTGSCILIQF